MHDTGIIIGETYFSRLAAGNYVIFPNMQITQYKTKIILNELLMNMQVRSAAVKHIFNCYPELLKEFSPISNWISEGIAYK